MGFHTNRVRKLVLLVLLLIASASAMAEEGAAGVPKQEAEAAGVPKQEEAAVHIVFVQKPDDVEPEVHHVRTLASVLGSEDAAKEALIYSYKTAASGFAAKLTSQQAAEMSKQPGVLQVQPDEVLELAAGPAAFNV